MEPQTVWVRDARGGRAVKLTVVGVIDPRASFGIGLFTSQATTANSGARAPGSNDLPAESRRWRQRRREDARAEPPARRARTPRRRDRRRGAPHPKPANAPERAASGFIGVGLLAGIAGLGVISMRVVVERRQQIGVMRALGFTRRAVQATFLLESSLVALLGIGCGVVLGLALSYRVVEHLGREFPEIIFRCRLQIALISLGAMAAALAMTFVPYQAGRVTPRRRYGWTELARGEGPLTGCPRRATAARTMPIVPTRPPAETTAISGSSG